MTVRRYGDPRAFRRALIDRLKAAARTRGMPLQELQRRFVLECFLARVFALPGERWLLKGGTGLAVRLTGARHSRDLDLCNTAADRELSSCIAELVNVGRAGDRDPFVFEINRRSALTGVTEGAQLTVTVRLGAQEFDKFPIDLTTGLTFVGPIQTIRKDLPVQIDDVQPPPPMRLYPLVDQIADKVAAMYETYNSRPSGRFRDLVDLVIILTAEDVEVDADLLVRALGGVSPIVVVPGRWAAADLRHQAEHVATMRLQNNGYNCVAGQVLVVSTDWPQRAEFLTQVQAAMARAPHRRDYYPGSVDRVRQAAETHTAVTDLDGRLMLTGIAAGDPALRTEYFAPVLAVTQLPGAGVGFLRRAVDFANGELTGTLGANVIALPGQVRTASFQRSLADLRYGAIGVNAWTAAAFLTARAPWGAFPGGDDPSSGVGVVHNALLLDGPERAVATGPFRRLPRSLAHGEPSVMPRPPWFVTHRAATTTTTRLTRYAADPHWWRIPGVLSAALRG